LKAKVKLAENGNIIRRPQLWDIYGPKMSLRMIGADKFENVSPDFEYLILLRWRSHFFHRERKEAVKVVKSTLKCAFVMHFSEFLHKTEHSLCRFKALKKSRLAYYCVEAEMVTWVSPDFKYLMLLEVAFIHTGR
jgi:hypothetical protein